MTANKLDFQQMLDLPGLSRAADLGTTADPLGTQINLAERLCLTFGMGDSPMIRRSFYDNVENTVNRYGREALKVVNQASQLANTARNPARFFCSSLKSRFQVRGWWPKDGSEESAFTR